MRVHSHVCAFACVSCNFLTINLLICSQFIIGADAQNIYQHLSDLGQEHREKERDTKIMPLLFSGTFYHTAVGDMLKIVYDDA